MKRCSNCILPETFPEIKLSKEGLCQYCLQSKDQGYLAKVKKIKEAKKREMIKNFMKYRQKNKYDCLLCLSGGKDSTALLYILKNEYNLNVLTYTCDNGFMSDIAWNNIRRTVNKLDVDHLIIKPKSSIFKKLFAYLLVHPLPSGRVMTICPICSTVMASSALKLAVSMKIPLLAFGYSPQQGPAFAELSPGFLKNRNIEYWRPLLGDIFDDIKDYFWDPKEYKWIWKYPKVYFPFHVLDYNVETVGKQVIDLGLIEPGNENPKVSNCLINTLMMYLDTKKLKYNPYIWEFSALIRNGQLDRQRCLEEFEDMERKIESGSFEKEKINFVLKKLGISIEDLLK